MCGIVGIISKKPFSVKNKLLKALKRLEYRGYDSVGFATLEGDVQKDVGHIGDFANSISDMETSLGISHTRWSTHGGALKINAHPHFNSAKTIFAVHNGIIDNFDELRKRLEKEGVKFITDTDSEIIPHYFDSMLKKGMKVEDAIKSFMKEVEGTYAILLFVKGQKKIYAIKKDSPLVLGICKDCFMLGSDIYAFSDETDEAIFFEDYEFAVIDDSSYEFFDKNGKKISKKSVKFKWDSIQETKEEYPHFMLKEIHEQPATSKRLINAFETTESSRLDKFVSILKGAHRIMFVAAGTSYHAALIGVFALNSIGIESQTVIASEFSNYTFIDNKTVVVAISQSGETMDVVAAIKEAKLKGAKIVSIVNVPYSTIQRLSEASLEILAGQEICVAATKSFTNQVITLLAIARKMGYKLDWTNIPEDIAKTIANNEEIVKKLASKLYKKHDIFVLGRGISYPIAREIALKLKEIPYIHAEGMMGGELKHGTIALIEKGTPVISLILNHDPDMVSNTLEVEARGADVIYISNTHGNIFIPEDVQGAEFSIYACVVGHLLSYYIARLKKLPIDKPRNLAKSVTVK